jgi:hypothetical protein
VNVCVLLLMRVRWLSLRCSAAARVRTLQLGSSTAPETSCNEAGAAKAPAQGVYIEASLYRQESQLPEAHSLAAKAGWRGSAAGAALLRWIVSPLPGSLAVNLKRAVSRYAGYPGILADEPENGCWREDASKSVR